METVLDIQIEDWKQVAKDKCYDQAQLLSNTCVEPLFASYVYFETYFNGNNN